MSLLDELNPQQREAVESTEGPLLILAGAGSGKTRVITYRIAWLIEHCGVRPSSILAVTFTNKAADEMRERVARLVPVAGVSRPWVSTFHSFCVRVLRDEGERIGLRHDFSIYDEDDQLRVVKACIRHLGLVEKEIQARPVLSRISFAKNHGRSPETFFQSAADPLAERVAVLFDLYTRDLKKAGAVDFDDLLLEAARLFREDAEAAMKYNERFHYILVDEFQDTNRPQYELVRLLTRVRQNLCAVGDEDQSIYSWRGADIRNIVEFEQDYPDAKILRLEENYRSTQCILDAASAVVAHNRYRKGKTLWTSRQGGAKIGLYAGLDAENESLFVADWISKRHGSEPETRFAVLYRTNAQSRLYEEALRRYSLAYNVVGAISFYERAEVKDLLAYLKAASNLQDSISLIRIINSPPRGIGETTVRKIEALALESGIAFWDAMGNALDENLLPSRSTAAVREFRSLMEELHQMLPQATVADILKTVIERTKYVDLLEQEGTPEAFSRLENIQELANAAADSRDRGENLQEFLDHAALVSDVDAYDGGARITLMTLHSAKGLEFPVVFLGGMEEGLLPHSRSLLNAQALEEERRLCYVGMTRAQDLLILTRAAARRHYGSQMPETSRPSRFLNEVPPQLIEDFSAPQPASRERIYEYNSEAYGQGTTRSPSFSNVRKYFGVEDAAALGNDSASAGLAPLRPGSRVRHPKYGYGTVLRREGNGENTKLTVSFPGVGVKKLVERYADLERM
ncbi:MAG: UvrD-helicase domain-containing protein [Acidobacteria bacterium]|nr:UvrD-helicase domain-containing protein [Acidobacteriota bacterium]